MEQLELVPYLLYEKEASGILWTEIDRREKLNAAVGGSERTGTLAEVGEYLRAGGDDTDALGGRSVRGRRLARKASLGPMASGSVRCLRGAVVLARTVRPSPRAAAHLAARANSTVVSLGLVGNGVRSLDRKGGRPRGWS